MAKNYKDKNLSKIMSVTKPKDESRVYINSRGISMEILPLPPYLIQMASTSVTKPNPPTYTVKLEGGGEETHIHDEESIAQSSDEEKLAWEKYKQELREVEIKSTELLINVILVEAVKVEIPNRDAWIKRQKLMGFPIPEDEEELMLMFKKTQVLGNEQDITEITRRAISLGGITEEELETVKNSFQDKVESESSEQ